MYRKDIGNVDNQTTTINEAKQQLVVATEKWNEFKNKAEEYREAELLDYYDGEIEEGDTPEIKEKQQKALKTVKDKLRRNETFIYLTKKLGKPKISLQKLRIIDPLTKVM